MEHDITNPPTQSQLNSWQVFNIGKEKIRKAQDEFVMWLAEEDEEDAKAIADLEKTPA
jgi:hypothetical protein